MEDISDVTMMQEFMKNADSTAPVEKLLNEFEAHEAKEEKALDEYRKALASIQDPASRFIMQMVISDEERHRAVAHAMAVTLKGSVNWSKPAGSLEGGPDQGEVTQNLIHITDELLDIEKSGIKEYKALLKDSAGYYHGLFKLLIETMIRDSEKHIEMLEFLRRRFKAA